MRMGLLPASIQLLVSSRYPGMTHGRILRRWNRQGLTLICLIYKWHELVLGSLFGAI